MAMQRANPLPVGKYWVDVFDNDRMTFRSWLAANSASVNVEREENFVTTKPSRDWYLFNVTAPVAWEGPGYPTIADPVNPPTTSDDTSQKPPPSPSIPEQIQSAEEGIKQGLTIGLIVVAGYIAYKVFS